VRHLGALADVRVIAPRPSYSLRAELRSARAEDVAAAPTFPRAWYVPRVGSRVNHLLMAASLRGPIARMQRVFSFDAVLASWAYPDGCGVAELARFDGFPFIVVAQGSDIHHYLGNPTRRRIILTSLARAGAVVTRSEELARLLREAGVAADKLHVIYNGVDGEIFHARGRAEARAALGYAATDRVILYVGNLVPVKNPTLLVDAFSALKDPNARLIIAGDGAQLEALKARANARVSFVGRKPEREVAQLMRAADTLCVPSDNEGVPNVILEAFACGLRVTATRVGGIPEIMTEAHLGELVPRGDASALSAALATALTAPDRSSDIAAHASRYTWQRTAAAYIALFETLLGASG